MAISAEGKIGNGVQLFDPETTVLRVLDSSATTYTGLSWRKECAGSRGAARTDRRPPRRPDARDPRLDGRRLGRTAAHVRPVERRDLPCRHAHRVVPPAVVVGRRQDDRSRLSRSGTTSRRRPAARRADGGGAAAARARSASRNAPLDEPAGVDIWHWTDPVVMARQKLSATQDRRRNLLAAWHLDSGKLVHDRASRTRKRSRRIRHTNTALVSEWSAFAMDRSIGRPAADLYLADLTTGARTKLKDNVNDRFAQVSPGGKYLLFLQDDQYFTINLATRRDDQHHEGRRRRRSSTRNRTRRSSRSRRSASPAGRKTTRRCCCTTSSTSGKCRRRRLEGARSG